MQKILSVVGARPQFVKAAVVSRALKKHPSCQEVLVHTGQHFDEQMSAVFFREMNIPEPAYNLEINGLSHAAMTAQMMMALEGVMKEEKPDVVLVFGDTNSTLAAALVAAKLHIPIAHVEAGLRSFDMNMPEEINRILTDRVSRYLFCPTETAVQNLHKELPGSDHSGIQLVGDVMYDAVLYYRDKIREIPPVQAVPEHPFALATIHRQENTDDPQRLREIVDILNDCHSKIPVYLPLHPRTRQKLLSSRLQLNAHIIDPLGYFDMLRYLDACKFVLTDSGGLQKEAFFFKKYCFTLRKQTEWVELTQLGLNFLCDTDMGKWQRAYRHINEHPFPETKKPYGDGDAGERIAGLLCV